MGVYVLLFQVQKCSHWIICKKAVLQAHLLTFICVEISEWGHKPADVIPTPFCHFIHFIWYTHNVSFTHELPESMLTQYVFSGFPCDVFVHKSPVVLRTLIISSVCVELNSLLSKVQVPVLLSQWTKDRALNINKTWWVRVQYQGLGHPTVPWNEREHSSSDSLLELYPPWATKRRLLEERTWCGNYVTKRSAQNLNSL